MNADTEKAVSDYLRAHSGVIAQNTRMVGKPPEDTDASWVQVMLIDESPVDTPDRLNEAYIQCDCYAGILGGQREANSIGIAVKDALNQIRNVTQGSVVLSGARASRRRLPDDDLNRERSIVTAFVWLHDG